MMLIDCRRSLLLFVRFGSIFGFIFGFISGFISHRFLKKFRLHFLHRFQCFPPGFSPVPYGNDHSFFQITRNKWLTVSHNNKILTFDHNWSTRRFASLREEHKIIDFQRFEIWKKIKAWKETIDVKIDAGALIEWVNLDRLKYRTFWSRKLTLALNFGKRDTLTELSPGT